MQSQTIDTAERGARVAVIGAGPMALAAALELAEAGAQVTVCRRVGHFRR